MVFTPIQLSVYLSLVFSVIELLLYLKKNFARFSLWGDSPFLFLVGFRLIIKQVLCLGEMCSELCEDVFRVVYVCS